MKIHKLNILFVLSRSRLNKNGKAPLFCRMTYLENRKQFSTGLFVKPKYWDNSSQSFKPPNEKNMFLNNEISLIKSKINQAFLLLQVNKEFFDVEDIYLQYRGENIKANATILEVFKKHNDKVEKLIGKEYVLPTLWKFKQARQLLKDFIKFKFKKNDYQFKDLNLNFIQDYEFYLKTEKNLAQSSTYKAIQRFRKIIKIGISEGNLDKDPFIMYKCKRPKTKIVFLTVDELEELENYNFSQSRLEQVKDMFVFCCYTGLAFNEMDSLLKSHLVVGFDGKNWIQMNRKKTDMKISIPLPPKANEILSKNLSFSKDERVFPKISNQKFNSYLKEIAEIVGIEKRLTHHIGRKTFATTVLLYNDVPMEIVSELLGHSSIKITQGHYAKVVQKKVSEHVQRLSEKLKN